MQRQRGLDQAYRTRSDVQVSEIGLDRADRTIAGIRAMRAIGGGQSGDLDRVAHRCGRAMRFHIADAACVDVGHGQGHRDNFGLALDARGGIADLGGAVVVGRIAADNAIDGVAILDRVRDALEQHHRGAVAEHRAGRPFVEGAAMPVRRQHAAFLVEVALSLRQHDGHAAGERHVALVRSDALACGGDGHQRGGARGLQGHRRAAQPQLEGDPGRKIVLVVTEFGLQ